MNIDNLLRDLCPEGVKRVRLGEVCCITTGEQLNKEGLSADKTLYPVMNGGINPSGYWKEFNTPANTIIISQGGASAGYTQFMEKPFWAGAHCYVVSLLNEETNLKYLYYFIKNNQDRLISTQQGAGIPSMSKKVFYDLLLPLPPLPVQESIVSYLDKLTSLTAELEAELELQKKRYDFYRNRLLSFAPDPTTQFGARLSNNGDYHKGPLLVKWAKLGEIAEIIRGGNFQKKDFVESGYPCIHYGQIYTHYGTSATKTITYVNEDVFNKSKKAQPNDIVMAVTSENIEDVCKCVAWLGKEPAAVSGHTAIIHHQQNAKYLSYYFHTAMFAEQKKKLAHGTKVIEVTPKALEEILIPLPPLSEQERIVGILDKYETLVNDTRQGIPALINAVQRKYEYYRERLLTF